MPLVHFAFGNALFDGLFLCDSQILKHQRTWILFGELDYDLGIIHLQFTFIFINQE